MRASLLFKVSFSALFLSQSCFAAVIHYSSDPITIEKNINFSGLVTDSGNYSGEANDRLRIHFNDGLWRHSLPYVYDETGNMVEYADVEGSGSVTASSVVRVRGNLSGTYAHAHQLSGSFSTDQARSDSVDYLSSLRTNYEFVSFRTAREGSIVPSVQAASHIYSGIPGETVSFNRSLSLEVNGRVQLTGYFDGAVVAVPDDFFKVDKDHAQVLADTFYYGGLAAAGVNYGMTVIDKSVKNALSSLTLTSIDQLCSSTLDCAFESYLTQIAFLLELGYEVATPSKKVEYISAGMSIIGSMLSNGFQDIADDPPDYNYTELAALDFEKLTELDNTILSAEETELMLNYMNYSLEAGRWLEVALRSLERYQGAAYSNDLFWAEAQLEHYLYAMEMYNQAISMGNVYQQELAALLDTYEAMDVAELDEQSINDALEEILTGIDSGLYDDYFNNTAQMLNINIDDLIGSVTNSAYEMSEFLITGVPLTLDVGDAQFTSNGADLLSVAQTVDSSGEAWLYLSIFYLIYRRSSRAD